MTAILASRYLLMTLGKAGAAWVRKELFKNMQSAPLSPKTLASKLVFSPKVFVFNLLNYSVFEMLVALFYSILCAFVEKGSTSSFVVVW